MDQTYFSCCDRYLQDQIFVTVAKMQFKDLMKQLLWQTERIRDDLALIYIVEEPPYSERRLMFPYDERMERYRMHRTNFFYYNEVRRSMLPKPCDDDWDDRSTLHDDFKAIRKLRTFEEMSLRWGGPKEYMWMKKPCVQKTQRYIRELERLK